MSDIGWAEEGIIQYDRIALEDHSYTATREERSRHQKSWKLSLNSEGVQGPLNQRSDLKGAKQTCKKMSQEHTHESSDKGAINSLKALKNMHIDLMLLQDGDTILLPQHIRLHLRHHDGNQAATCGRRGTGIRGNLHLGANSVFFSKKLFQNELFFNSFSRNLIDGQV